MRYRYFVHATSMRVSDSEYSLASETDDKDLEDHPVSFTESTIPTSQTSDHEPEVGHFDENDLPDGDEETVDSETDPESDYDEGREEEADEWPDEVVAGSDENLPAPQSPPANDVGALCCLSQWHLFIL